MINDTYNQFYGKFRDQFNPEEYIEVVRDEELVDRFEGRLDTDGTNTLTKESMPFLDLGNIPSTHSFMRSESQQVYYVPHNMNPDMVFVRYSSFLPRYLSLDLKARFEGSNLKYKGIT